MFKVRRTTKVGPRSRHRVVHRAPQVGFAQRTRPRRCVPSPAEKSPARGWAQFRQAGGFDGEIIAVQPETAAPGDGFRPAGQIVQRSDGQVGGVLDDGRRDVGIVQPVQSSQVVPPRGIRVFFEVRAADEVGFTLRLQTRHPPPGERIARRIGVEEVPEKKISAERPG